MLGELYKASEDTSGAFLFRFYQRVIYQTGEQEVQELFRILCVFTVNKATAPDAALSPRLYGGALAR